MTSRIASHTRAIIISIIAAASFGAVAVPFVASTAPAAVTSIAAGPIHNAASPNDTPWP